MNGCTDDECVHCVICGSTQESRQRGLCPDHTYDDPEEPF